MKLLLLTTIMLLSCTTLSYKLRLQDKTLLIHPDYPKKLIYPTFKTVCEFPDRILFKKCKKVHIIEEYDLEDKPTLQTLSGAAFECRSSARFKY